MQKVISRLATDGGTSATYYYLTDSHGDVREVTDKQGNTLVKYSYDAWGNPTNVKWTPSQAGSDSSSDVIPETSGIQTTISYKYDSWSVLKETRETPSVSYTIDYSYKDDDSPLSLTYNDATYYYLTDGHGDVREITDKQGNTLVKYSYDAWGNPVTVIATPPTAGEAISETATLDSVSLAVTNPYTYASYRYDSDTGI